MKKYVKEYMGHKVPEGSSHYDINLNSSFYNIISNHETKYYQRSTSQWVESINGNDWHHENLKELPEAEWEPVVGEECEAAWLELPDGGSNDFCPVMVKGYFGEKVWFTELIGQNYETVVNLKDCIFRPTKSAKDLEREAFIESAITVYYAGVESGDMAAALFDAGFTAPLEKND
jgi:hypothetical protein